MSSSNRNIPQTDPGAQTAAESSPRYINPYKQFLGSFIPQWLERMPIALGAKAVYGRLCRYAGKSGVVRGVPHDQLAQDLSLGKTSVRKYLAILEQNGLIDIRQVGFTRPNEYRFLWHPAMGAFRKDSDIHESRGGDTHECRMGDIHECRGGDTHNTSGESSLKRRKERVVPIWRKYENQRKRPGSEASAEWLERHLATLRDTS